MKKLVLLSKILALLTTAAPAQMRNEDRLRRQLIRPERLELRKSILRYELLTRKTQRDGMVAPIERKRFQKLKRYNRRKALHSLRRYP